VISPAPGRYIKKLRPESYCTEFAACAKSDALSDGQSTALRPKGLQCRDYLQRLALSACELPVGCVKLQRNAQRGRGLLLRGPAAR